MAWQSNSFQASRRAPSGADAEKISKASQKHRPAMDKVVQQARDLAKERRDTLDLIQDPVLKRSAAR
jgi:hypothetical protein